MNRCIRLFLVVFFGLFICVPAAAQPLNDIQGHWAEGHIKQLSSASVLGGYPDGSFRPDDPMTREEFVSCLVRVMQIPVTGPVLSSYRDIGSDAWSYPVIETAVMAGILMPGESINGLFRPQEPVSRAEAARMIVRALKIPVQSTVAGYDDGVNIPAAYRGYIRATKDHNLMSGYPDGTFRPWHPVTRAEATVILLRMFYEAGKGKGMVTICYDHGSASVYKNAYPLHLQYNYPGVNFVIPAHVGAREMVNLEQLKEMEAHGWETGSHSKNHLHFKDLRDREIRDQLEQPKEWLRQNGLGYASFAYPFWFDTDPYPVVSEYHDAAVTCFGKVINLLPANRYKLERFMYDAGLNDNSVLDLLDETAVKGGWLILYTHSVTEGNQAAENHGINQQRLQLLFEEIKKRGLKVVTVSEGINYACYEH